MNENWEEKDHILFLLNLRKVWLELDRARIIEQQLRKQHIHEKWSNALSRVGFVLLSFFFWAVMVL